MIERNELKNFYNMFFFEFDKTKIINKRKTMC